MSNEIDVECAAAWQGKVRDEVRRRLRVLRFLARLAPDEAATRAASEVNEALRLAANLSMTAGCLQLLLDPEVLFTGAELEEIRVHQRMISGPRGQA